MVRVEFELIRNPKAYRQKPFVARIDVENGKLEFLRATIPVYEKGVLVGGEFELEPGNYYIVRSDRSSHKNTRTLYELYYVGGDVEKIAWIMFVNRTPEFSNEEIKEIYATTKGNGRRVINALIEYARRHSRKMKKIEIDEIIKTEIEELVKKLEEKYGVKIKLNIVIEK